MRDEQFQAVLGRLDDGPKPADEELGRRMWARIEPALLADPEVDVAVESTGTVVATHARRERRRWSRGALALAGAVAALVGLAVVLTSGDDGESEVVTADSVPVTTAPDPTVQPRTAPSTTVPDTALPGSAGTVLDAELAMQVAFGPDGTPWAVVDPPGPASWAIVRREGATWDTMATEGDESSPDFESGSRNFPFIVGIRPDGTVWIHEMVGRPEGPFELWEFDGDRWTDHREAGLGGAGDFGMGCCGVSMAPDGTVWTSMGGGDQSVVRRYDADGWVTLADMTSEELVARAGEPGFPRPVLDVLDRLDFDVAVAADPRCLERVGGDGYDLEDPGVALGALRQATLATAVGPDGAIWHAVVCVGVVRFDPADETTTVFVVDESLDDQLVTGLAVAPDGSIWFTGAGGILRVDLADTIAESGPREGPTDED